jgi:DNA polymerase V
MKNQSTALKKQEVSYLYSSSVSCGFPSPADEYLDGPLDLNDLLVKKPAATFFVRAKGDSMIDEGIFEGDILIIDRSVQPRSGQVVLAVINGEFTLKRLIKNGAQIILQPENPKYNPIQVTAEMDFQVWGVAVHCIHKLN